MGGRKDIYKDANGFDKNPQNINKEGRPKKNYNEIIDELRAKGYKPPTKSDYFEMIGMLLVMSEKDMDEYESDKERPFWIRGIIKDLRDKNTRSKINADYRDWLFGKAQQKIDVDTKGSIITIQECQKNV
jgi:hypothetical protein